MLKQFSTIYIFIHIYIICNPTAANSTCRAEHFTCANGRCIRASYVNDGDNDCGDQSDEQASECMQHIHMYVSVSPFFFFHFIFSNIQLSCSRYAQIVRYFDILDSIYFPKLYNIVN